MSLSTFSEFMLSAKLEFQSRIVKNQDSSKTLSASLDDFKIVKTIAEGGYGRVDLALRKQTMEYKAIKIIYVREGNKFQLEDVVREKTILDAIRFPFIVNLDCHFVDSTYHYLVLEFVQGGDLFSLLYSYTTLPLNHAKFYIAQLILSVEFLHSIDVIHGDLKPENVLLDMQGYIKLTDFGSAVQFTEPMKIKRGSVGYKALELTRGQKSDKTVDWWALGVMLYELYEGSTPFNGSTEEEINAKTEQGIVYYPHFFSPALIDIVKKLLHKDPAKRLGNLVSGNGSQDIRNHDFFDSINFDDIFERKVLAPYIPEPVDGPGDTRHFKF